MDTVCLHLPVSDERNYMIISRQASSQKEAIPEFQMLYLFVMIEREILLLLVFLLIINSNGLPLKHEKAMTGRLIT